MANPGAAANPAPARRRRFVRPGCRRVAEPLSLAFPRALYERTIYNLFTNS